MKCKSCKINEAIEYEEIGLGQYCQKCLDKEIKVWKEEAGFEE